MNFSKMLYQLLCQSTFLFALLLSPVWSADAPQLSRVAVTEGQVAIEYSASQALSGLNVYRDGGYLTTIKPAPQQGEISFTGSSGRYCIVAITGDGANQQYSPCSNTMDSVASANNGTGGSGAGVPSDVRASVYSATAAELFWSPPTDNATVTGYRLFRDGRLVYAGNGRSHFEGSLVEGRVYRYSVISVGNNDAQSDAAEYALTAGDTNSNNPDPITATPSAGSLNTPANFRGEFYSSTAAELFWDAVQGNGIEYQLFRDQTLLTSTTGRSYFEGDLQPGRTYQYQIRAMDNTGTASGDAAFTLAPAGSTNPNPNPINGPVNNPGGNADFAIRFNLDRFDLQEGNEGGLVVPVQIQRFNDNRANINLSLRAERGEFSRYLRYSFDHSTIRGESNTQLRIWLDIAAMPLQFEERRYILSAEQQGVRTETTLYLNIIPVDAPDVYLLIGQSNMEGASERYIKNSGPGGPDERNSRIMQLNVRQNSTEVFYQNWQFVDEQTNVSEPRFIEAEDPLHEPRAPWQGSKQAQFIGPGLSFAKAALAETSRQIFLVPSAWSASGFCRNDFGDIGWNAYTTEAPGHSGTLLADRALTRLNMTLRDTGGILRGILWHQGEADSNNPDCAYRYQENIRRLAERLRNQARGDRRGGAARGGNSDVPFIVGTMSKGRDDRGDFSQFGELKTVVDTVHRNISLLIPHAAFVNNDDLRPPTYHCGDNSCVHFGGAAYREMGYRFYQALKTVWATNGNN